MMIACLIVSMLSNSITMFARTLCWRNARSIALRIVSPGSKATKGSPPRSAGLDQRPPGQPVIGMADEGHGLLAQRHHAERAVGRRVGHDAEVGLAGQHRFHDLVGMQALELDAGLGIERHELLHRPAHVVQADRVDGRHPHGAVDPGLDGGHLGLGLLPGLEDAAGGHVEGLALPGDHEGPLGAVDQHHAELRLELLHGLAGRRLGDEVLLGPAREGPEPDDVAVEPERFEVHAVSLLH